MERLERLRPDALVVRGTSLLRPPALIGTAPLALNLHAGLSPYYRGTHCTEWALINWDPYNIGVTLHALTMRIDGGDIASQERAKVEPNDDVTTIEAKIGIAGTALVRDALESVGAGRVLPFHRQALNNGYLTLHRQWSFACDILVASLLRTGRVGVMLKHPSRREPPIVAPSDERIAARGSDPTGGTPPVGRSPR